MDFRARRKSVTSVTSETSEDLLECMAQKEKKSLTLQTSEGMRSPVRRLELFGLPSNKTQ